MIGVGQDDLGVEFALQVALHDALDRRLRAHRHENRGVDDAMCGVDAAGAGTGVGALGEKFEMHYFTVRELRSDKGGHLRPIGVQRIEDNVYRLTFGPVVTQSAPFDPRCTTERFVAIRETVAEPLLANRRI